MISIIYEASGIARKIFGGKFKCGFFLHKIHILFEDIWGEITPKPT